MPGKYVIEAVYSLTTEVTPDGRMGGVEDGEGVLEYEEMSSFYGDEITCEGGTVQFAIEADSEDQARHRAEDVLASAYYSGDGYFEWEIADYSISSIEEVEPPMDMEKALEIIRAYFGTAEGLTDEQRAAFIFMLERLTP